MSKISAMLPTYASSRFEIDKPDNWDDMTDSEKSDYFLEHMRSVASLCHQCDDIESYFECDLGWYEKEPDKDLAEMFYEEDN